MALREKIEMLGFYNIENPWVINQMLYLNI